MSYGSIPDTHIQRPHVAQRLSLMSMARFSLATIFASVLIITLSALSRISTSEILISTNLPTTMIQMPEGRKNKQIKVRYQKLVYVSLTKWSEGLV
jgi:hypothetical protein